MPGDLKAAGFNSAVVVLKTMVEPAAFERFVAALPDAEAQLIRRPRIATTWIPVELTNGVLTAAHQTLFGGDDEQMFELGRRQIKEDLSTLYRVFIRIASPAYVAARAAKIWDTYARNSGRLAVVAEGANFTDLRVDDYPIVAPSFGPFFRGNIHGTVEMTRVPGVAVRITEGGGQHRFGVLHASWG